MDRRTKIEEEVQKTLQRFEGAERLPKDPFFFTRLQARIEKEETQKRSVPESILKAWLRPASLIGIVAVNILMIIFVFEKSNSQTRQDRIQVFAETYALYKSQSNIFLFNE